MSDHKAEEVKGRIKEVAGEITGDEGLKRSGKLEQASAKTKRAVDDVTDKVKSVVHPED